MPFAVDFGAVCRRSATAKGAFARPRRIAESEAVGNAAEFVAGSADVEHCNRDEHEGCGAGIWKEQDRGAVSAKTRW